MFKNMLLAVILFLSVMTVPQLSFAEHNHEAPVEFKKPIIKTGEKSTLQKLIDATKPGDTLVLEGRVYRGSVTIDKPITIQGVEGTEIHSLSTALTIADSKQVLLENIVFNAEETAIVASKVSDLTFNDVRIVNSHAGIIVTDSEDISLHNVTIEGRAGHFKTKNHAVAMYNAKNVTVTNSAISDVLDGLYLESVEGIELQENTVKNSRYAMHFMYSDNINLTKNTLVHNMAGFMIMIGKNLTLIDNVVTKNNTLNSLGVYFYDVEQVEFERNTLSENTVAMDVQNTKKMVAKSNEFQTNGTVLQVKRSPDLIVSDNQFYGNILTIRSDQNRLQLANNFYDDYSGHDYDGDGIGDTAYIATNSFGQWLVKKPVYQYFMESPSVIVLNMMDTEVTGNHALIVTDDRPNIMKNSFEWSWNINCVQLLFSSIVLVAMLVVRRKLI